MDNHHIWEVLLSNGTITHDQLSDALRWQRSHPDEDVGSILLARGIVTDGQLLAAYAQRLDVPFIEKDLVVKRPEVLKLVPETLARRSASCRWTLTTTRSSSPSPTRRT